jgi:ABC-2 type transport system ATP-binding protein
MLEIRNLTKRYNGIAAVDNVSFTIKPGEILGYVGPNGAGKSTTVKMIIGLLEPSDGQVLFRGRSVIDDPPAFQRLLGYVPEEPNLYPYLSGWEYLQLVGRLRALPRPVLEAKLDQFLHLFNLWEDRHCPLSSFSKGMRQKILLSASLMHDPELLILDEPLSGLDVTTAIVLRELLRGLAAQGKMILYCSHVLEVLEKACASVLILSHGRVLAHDTLENLRHRENQSSLEGIFAQLTQKEDHPSIAGRILEAMRV